jgi:thiol-disulfide isomerase/thioredoxin
MNKRFFLCLFLLVAANLAAQDRIIENPAYEFNPSGIINISKIELGENETRVYVHTTFIPGWWVMFSKKGYLEDCATGKKWYVTDIRKGEFDKKISMPASGDSTFILVFPKIDKSVEKINYYEEDINSRSYIYGISLNPKVKRRSPDNSVPYGVTKWINGELAKAKRKTLMNFDAGEFFSHDTARLIGYIKGYDRRAGFESGIIYLGNEITGEDCPRVVRIYPDGRFDCLLPVSYPQNLKVAFQNRHFDFYIQPGTALSMILDWEEFRTADRLRNIHYKFSDIQYDGATASVNKELTAFYSKLEDLPYQKIYNERNNKEPDEYKTLLKQLTSKYTEACRQAANDKNMSELAKSIIKNNSEVVYARFLLDYEMSNFRYSDKGKLPVEFYEFLKNVPVNNRQILTAESFSSFINRLEFSQILFVLFEGRYPTPEKSFEQYLYEELGLPRTPEDVNFFKERDSLGKQLQVHDITDDERQGLYDKKRKVQSVYDERYKKQIEDYAEKYMNVIHIRSLNVSDSIYENVLKLKPGIVSDLIKTRRLDMLFGRTLKINEKNHSEILASITNSLHENFFKQEAERLFKKHFSPNKQTGYELPETEDAVAFKKIIKPFKGKYILVDFWATWCGPCIHGIKQGKSMRESYKDSKDATFVFITSDKDSPTNQYEQLVKEQEMTNSFRVSELDYQYFRQLFAFNGIPHYIVVDREGRILNSITGTHNFENTLKELLEKEKQQ